MTWFGWVLLGEWTLAVLLAISTIGKPREPLDAQTVCVMVVLNVASAIGLLTVGTGSL